MTPGPGRAAAEPLRAAGAARAALLGLALAGLLPLLPLSGAQSFVDAVGDVAVDAPLPSGGAQGFEPIDLKTLDVQEDPEGFLVTAGVASTEGSTDDVRVREANLEVPLTVGGRPFVVEFQRSSGTYLHHRVLVYNVTDGGARTLLYVGNDWEDGQPFVDRAAGTLSAFLPRSLLAPDGLQAGTPLEVGPVGSYTYVTSGFASDAPLVRASDRMPDDGGTASAALRYGAPALEVAVASAQPFRVSNGEATTFIFVFNLTSRAASAAGYDLAVTGAPSQWSVELSTHRVQLAPGQTATVAAFATTPFAHAHGRVDWADLVATRDGAPAGGIPFGVRYTPIPRPAGHHDTLYVHARQVGVGLEYSANQAVAPDDSGLPGFVSTLESDDRADEQPITGQPEFLAGGDPAVIRWKLPLSPRLDIGLDLDHSRQGAMRLAFSLPHGSVSGTLGGRVAVAGVDGPSETRAESPFEGRPVQDLATLDESPLSLGDGQTAIVTAALRAVDGVEQIPATPGSDLVLDLWLRLDGPSTVQSQTVPRLLPGGWVQLPLDEYNELATGAFASGAGAPTLSFAQPVLRVEPGRSAAWAGTYLPADAQAALAGPKEFRLSQSGAGSARVVVDVPATAVPGDTYVAYFLAQTPQGQAAQRLVAQVVAAQADTGAYLDVQPAKHSSPAPSAAAFLALAACVIVGRRRRG